MTVSNRHPFRIVSLLLDRYGPDLEFEFSRYIHTPQQLLDKREVFTKKGTQIVESWLNEIFDSLRDDEELALHSKVRRRDRNYHIPMIDFVCKDWSYRLESELANYLPRSVVRELLVFSSGRSFHAYGLTLLEPKEWHELMGRLLLINPPDAVPYVDTRWIGHRLIGGFSSLRWSCNTGAYKKYPERLFDSQRVKLRSESNSE